MDPITPITAGTPALPSRSAPPVERLHRISRERDRPPKEDPDRRREQPEKRRPADEEDPEGPRIDVLA